MNRRSFLKGLGALAAMAVAPAIVVPERRIWQVGARLGPSTLADALSSCPPGGRIVLPPGHSETVTATAVRLKRALIEKKGEELLDGYVEDFREAFSENARFPSDGEAWSNLVSGEPMNPSRLAMASRIRFADERLDRGPIVFSPELYSEWVALEDGG